MVTALLIPGIIFTVLLALNFMLISQDSSSAVPFGTLLTLIALWFMISLPLSILGAYYGFKASNLELPCKTNQIPRQIPTPASFFMNAFPASLIAGILPFGAIYVELFFIMSSVWSHRIYYMFGFLAFIFLIFVATCSLVSILFVYFQLCSEVFIY